MIVAGEDKRRQYRESGWWGDRTFADLFAANAAAHPDRLALVDAPNRGDFAFGEPQRLSYAELDRDFDSSGMPLVETGAKYSNASRLGDVLSTESWVEEWSGKTFLVKHKFTHSDGRPALEGFERRVWVRRDPDHRVGIRATPVPEEVIARFVD